ncbi:hypothetical protein HK405_008959, partial [Cladochytrium tenue]
MPTRPPAEAQPPTSPWAAAPAGPQTPLLPAAAARDAEAQTNLLGGGSSESGGRPHRPHHAHHRHTHHRHLARRLQARHLVMMSIGGTIGTGLFVASGLTVAVAGPVGALAAYGIVGVMVFFVVAALGEMSALIPVSGSFHDFVSFITLR